jgi:hypothetical protein
MKDPPDNPLIFHTARQLGVLHGPHAHEYVAKLAADALKRSDTEKHDFWKCVKAALGPRQKRKLRHDRPSRTSRGRKR